MKLKVFIHAQYSEYSKKYHFIPWQQDMSTQAHCGPMVGTHEFEFDEPPQEVLLKGTIEAYKQEQKAVMAEAERRHSEIQQRINDMLCIEYKPEAQSA